MILAVGEILFDIYPEYQRLGGAPFNFASHVKTFGLPIAFASRVGDDDNGRQIWRTVEDGGFDMRYMQRDPDHETGHVRVELDREGVPTFDIVKNVAYDFLDYSEAINRLVHSGPRLIYFGTLIQRTAHGLGTIKQILANRSPDTRGFCDINLRPDCYSETTIRHSLQNSDVLKINDDELALIQEMLSIPGDRAEAVSQLRNHYQIDWVCLTRGKHGSELFTADGHVSTPIEKQVAQVDTVGAGDAYASILAIGYLLGWPPNTILERATEFAGAVCTVKGAIPDDPQFYQPYLKWTEGV